MNICVYKIYIFILEIFFGFTICMTCTKTLSYVIIYKQGLNVKSTYKIKM